MTEVPFNPAVKDGRGVRGLAVPKSNWANTIDTAPFEAYAGDLRPHLHLRRAQDHDQRRGREHRRHVIPGLFAAGELVGGLFYHNYPAAAGWCPARCSASSRATAPASTCRTRTKGAMARKKAPLPKSWPEGAVYTVGHSTLSIEDFVALLAHLRDRDPRRHPHRAAVAAQPTVQRRCPAPGARGARRRVCRHAGPGRTAQDVEGVRPTRVGATTAFAATPTTCRRPPSRQRSTG